MKRVIKTITTPTQSLSNSKLVGTLLFLKSYSSRISPVLAGYMAYFHLQQYEAKSL